MAKISWRASADADLVEHQKSRAADLTRKADESVINMQLHSSGLGFNGYFVLSVLPASLPCLVTIFVWSEMGWGKESAEFLVENEAISKGCAGFVAGLVFALYLLDFFWPPHLPGKYLTLFSRDDCVGRLIVSVIGLALFGAALLSAKDLPTVPVIVTVLCGPVALAALRVATRPKAESRRPGEDDRAEALRSLALLAGEQGDARNFYAAAMTALILSGAWTMLAWLLWALSESLDLSDVTLGDKEKELIYLRWVSPLVAGCCNVVFGLIVQLRVRMSSHLEETDELKIQAILKVDDVEDEVDSCEKLIGKHLRQSGCMEEFARLPEDEQQRFARKHLQNVFELSKTMKIVGCGLLCLTGGVYVAAELVAADSHVAQLVLGMVGVTFLTFIAFLCVSFGQLMSTLKDWCLECPLGRMALAVSQSDWARAFVVCVALPVVPALLLLSVANQLVRRCRGLYMRIPPRQKRAVSRRASDAPLGATGVRDSKCSVGAEVIEVEASPQDQLITERVMVFLQAMRQWNWISVAPKIYIMALMFVGYTLTPRVLNVVLAWLCSKLKKLPFALTIVATLVSGLSCFLLPPVPGVPVYLFTGVIVTGTCPLGFWPGCAISVSLGLLLKLSACAMQQKMIGQALGSSIRIKSQVGINKPFIRAIEAVLRTPGWSVGKVAILCGGPDWPTSVLAGVLRLSLLEMELGTLPIIFFVGPCTLTGAFYLRKEESETWSRSANLMVASTMAVNMALAVAAAWSIQDQLDQNNWEVTKPLAQNVDLDWLDYRSDQIARSCVVSWRDVPCCVRYIALLGAFVEICVGQTFYWSASTCFGSFAITDDVATLELFGNNGLVKPVGQLGLLCVVGGFLGYICLVCFLKQKQAKPFAAKAARLKSMEGPWKENRLREALEAKHQLKRSVSELVRITVNDGMKRSVRALDKE